MGYRTAEREERVGTLEFRLTCLESFEDAVDDVYRRLEALGRPELLDTLCPYFGYLWPGARVLARWLWEQGATALQGRRVLEIGCGLALPSFVAARLGADVVATDHHPDVPIFLAQNLKRNPGTTVRFQRLDWTAEDKSVGPYDWIIASDILYERHQADALATLLQRSLTRDGRAVILDPNRPFWERLVGKAKQNGLSVTIERRDSMVLLSISRERANHANR